MEIIKQSDIVQPFVENLQLTATLPQEMVGAQGQLISWSEKKISVEKAECEDLRLAVEHAKKMKWRSGPLQTQYNKSVKRVQYYEKIKSALEQGYYIVPNFPIQMFAIRKGSRINPTGWSSTDWGNHEQKASELPIGDGEYKNPFPIVFRERRILDNGKVESQSYPTSWDEFEFPINMAKPEIMSVTQTALALKTFDRVGVMPRVRKKKEDPVIIGQIINKSGPFSEKVASFMIAWHLNTNVL